MIIEVIKELGLGLVLGGFCAPHHDDVIHDDVIHDVIHDGQGAVCVK